MRHPVESSCVPRRPLHSADADMAHADTVWPIGDVTDAALASRLEVALADAGPMLAAALLPALLSALREVRTPPVAARHPALLTVTEAARQLGIGRTTTFSLIRTGELRSVSVGRRRLVPSDAIAELVARLSTGGSRPA